ncbi:MAG: cell division protein FtsQ [Actinomycetota bacterium]|jgi:cell division protein FtsQ|nr:cell division protein FtsQ [Actinomycetota bacterium]
MTDLVDVATPRMDPRIRERRVAVKRDEGRRRLRLLMAGVGALAVGAVVYAVLRSPLLDVDTIRVRGAANTTPAEVATAGGLDRHPQLVDLDSAKVATRIESLPWVQRATVARRWPGTVEVTLLERTPLAAVPGDGGWAMVDATGRVLEVAAEAPAGMPTITTPVAAPPPGSRVSTSTRGGLLVLQSLPGSLTTRILGIDVDDQGGLQLRLDGAPTVRFGPPTSVRPKLVAVATLLSRTNLRGVTSVDVRVPTAPVLTRT